MTHRTRVYDLGYERATTAAPVGPFRVRCTCGDESEVFESADDAEAAQRAHYRENHAKESTA